MYEYDTQRITACHATLVRLSIHTDPMTSSYAGDVACTTIGVSGKTDPHARRQVWSINAINLQTRRKQSYISTGLPAKVRENIPEVCPRFQEKCPTVLIRSTRKQMISRQNERHDEMTK